MRSTKLKTKWRRSAVLAACAVCAAVSVSEPGRMVVAAAFHDPLALLAQRSPGARAPGALTQTKHARKKRAAPRRKGGGAGAPKQRVLANVRSRAPAAGGVADPTSSVLGTPSALDILDPLPIFSTDSSPTPSPTGFGGTGSGGGGSYTASPVAGGGGSTPGVVTTPVAPDPTPTPTPVVSSAPEPATWLMLIIGFGGIGMTLRTRRAVPTQTDASPASA